MTCAVMMISSPVAKRPRRADCSCCRLSEFAGLQRQESEQEHDQQGEAVRRVLTAAEQEEGGSQCESCDGGNDPGRRAPAVTCQQNPGRKKESR